MVTQIPPSPEAASGSEIEYIKWCCDLLVARLEGERTRRSNIRRDAHATMIGIPLIVGFCLHDRKLVEGSVVELVILIALVTSLGFASWAWYNTMRSDEFTTSFDDAQLVDHDDTPGEHDYLSRYRLFRDHLRLALRSAKSQGTILASWRGRCLKTALVAITLALGLSLLALHDMSPKNPSDQPRPTPNPSQPTPVRPETQPSKPAPTQPLQPENLRESYDGPIHTDHKPPSKK